MYQALQIFSQKFQQYDYIWQLEMDLRFTANVHDTLQSATAFARAQRQRNLWERNGRFYIPHLYNTYENFSAVVDAEFGDTGIWGPVQTPDFIPKGMYVKPNPFIFLPSHTIKMTLPCNYTQVISFCNFTLIGTSWPSLQSLSIVELTTNLSLVNHHAELITTGALAKKPT